MTTNIYLKVHRDGRFIFRWRGIPLRIFTLREALRYAQSAPTNTLIDDRTHDDPDEVNSTLDDTDFNYSH